MTSNKGIRLALGLVLLCGLALSANAQDATPSDAAASAPAPEAGAPAREAAAPTADEIAEAERAKTACRNGRGDAAECANYAYYLYWGTGTATDDETAFRLATKACEEGVSSGCYTAGNIRYWPNTSPVNLTESVTWWGRGCELSHAQSCIYLGEMHRDGEGTGMNGELARQAFGRACLYGNGQGCQREGDIYADGLYGVAKNEGNAVTSYRAGCALDHMLSCAYLGWMAYNGLGMDFDPALAVREYLHACAGNEQWACDRVEEIRAEGAGSAGHAELLAREELERTIPADLPLEQRYLIATAVFQNGNIPLAVTAFEDLSRAGLADASFQLGFIYYDGQGVPVDQPRAVQYWDRAANDGHPYAKFVVAQFYHSGTFVDWNEIWSIALMRSAAENGIPEAEPIWREWQAAMDARDEERARLDRQNAIESEASQRAADAANMSRIRDLYSSGQNQKDNEQVCGMVYRNNQANQECMARETFDKYYNPAFQ